MDLLKNAGYLRTLLTIAGLSNLSATTDTPAAIIELHYDRRGVKHESKFTVQELLDGVTQTTTDEQSKPQGDFTDIADIP